MKRINRPILIAILLLLVVVQPSCNRITPSGFWKSYQSKFIDVHKSDQGPWGGHRKIIWRYDDTHAMDKNDVIKYAQDNDWQLMDSLIFKNDSLEILSSYSRKDYSYQILEKNLVPSLNPSFTYQIFVFKTRWIAVEPGNQRETEKNGFVVFNSNNRELMIFHLWGE